MEEEEGEMKTYCLRVQSVSLGWLNSSGGDNCAGWTIMWMYLMLLKYILKMVKVETLFFFACFNTIKSAIWKI